MKRLNNVWSTFSDEETLLTAIRTAAKGKRKYRKVRRVLKKDKDAAHELSVMLNAGKFKPSPYKVDKIKTEYGKEIIMKKILLKGVVLMSLAFFCSVSAVEKVESVTKTINGDTDEKSTEQQSANDSISTKDFLENAPYYSVKKVIETDSLGNTIINEDGTTRYKYLLIDKNGNVCAANTAKKHLNSALKSGAFILLKVGGGATAGGLLGKKLGGSKKGAWIGAGVGAAAGVLASMNDIKAVKKQVKLMKECKKVLSAYQNTFTEEGFPLDAAADLSNVDGINFTECEEITKSAADVRAELLASKTEGDSLEDVDLPDDIDV